MKLQLRPKADRLRGARDILLLGSGFALFTGLVEAARIGVIRVAFSGFTWLPSYAPWMVPLAYLIYFAVPTVVVAVLYMFVPRLRLWAATLPLALLSAISLLTLFGRNRIAEWAILVLAAGLAINAARWSRAHEARLKRLLPPLNLAMAGTVACLLAGLPGSRALQRRAALARLVEAPAGLPNVLIIILDTVRAANLSLYGYNRPTTPNLEQWAQRGVVFDHAFSTAPWTLSSHASLFTGFWPHELTANWTKPLTHSPRTLAEVYQASGYHTAGFVANTIYAGRESGLGRGFIDYSDFRPTWKQFFLSSSLGQILEGLGKPQEPFYARSHRKPGWLVTADFLEWQARNQDRPFFVFLNYFDAHEPYLPTRIFREKFQHADRAIGGYDGAIASLDNQLNKMFEELDRRGVLDKTLVIVTSDHGELLGEHGLRSHGNSLYQQVLHVPLAIWGPRVPAGLRIQQPVTLRDLPRTMLELSIGSAALPGTSLAYTWHASPYFGSPLLAHVRKGIRGDSTFPVSRGDMFSLTTGGWHYIRNGDGVEELYSITADPPKSRNLAHDLSVQADLQRLRTDLARLAAAQSTDGWKAR